MNHITFPGLGVELNISKTAFSIFGTNITWYAVLIVFAIIIAFAIYKKRDGLYDIKFQTILELSIYVIPIAFLFARLYYVVFSLDYFLKNPLQILNIKQGGLAIYGGVIGGAIICYVYSKKKNIKLLDLLDYIVPGLVLRTSNRKMGQFHKCRGIWREDNKFFENGDIRRRYI